MNGVVRLLTMLTGVAVLAAAAVTVSPASSHPRTCPGASGRASADDRSGRLAAGQRPARPLLAWLSDTVEDAQVVDLRLTSVTAARAAATPGTVLARADPVRFQTVDVYVDPGDKPLAAYQFSVTAAAKTALLAGLEGGDHPAFARPPYYDPKALIDEAVVVAALSTADDLPRGRTRVARLHVQVTGRDDPRYDAKLHVAAGPDGTPLHAKVTVDAGK